MNSLATIQRIKNLEPIEGADKIELCKFYGIGYQCVVQKGIHSVDDLVVFIEPDTVVPNKPCFSFLEKSKFRVKQMVLRGESSQGLVLPLKEIEGNVNLNDIREEGFDLTDILKIKKYEKPVSAQLNGLAEGYYPTRIIPITDEKNLLSDPKLFRELSKYPCYIALKADGSSGACIRDLNDKLWVCSRQLSLKEDENNSFWKMVRKYKMDSIPKGYAINFELCGPKVNGNKMELKEHDAFVFNVYKLLDPIGYQLLGYDEMLLFCQKYKLKTVSTLYSCKVPLKNSTFSTIESLQSYADTVKYGQDRDGEGIIVRPLEPVWSDRLRRPLSGKFINNNYKG